MSTRVFHFSPEALFFMLEHESRRVRQAKNLTDEVWHHIFGFVGDPMSFRALEKTCLHFHKMLQDDNLWKACSVGSGPWKDEEMSEQDLDPDGKKEDHWRDQALLPIAIENIKKWQSSSENILLDAYGKIWKEDIESYLNDGRFVVDDQGADIHKFSLRGDAAWTLACLVEENVLALLQWALVNAIPIDRPAGKCVFPCDILAASHMMDRSAPGPTFANTEDSNYNHDIYSGEAENMYVRRLAYRAGIPKMDHRTYQAVTLAMVQLSRRIALQPCIELMSTPVSRPHPQVVLEPGENLKSVAPNPTLELAEGGQRVWTHVIVPRHMTNAAERCGLRFTKVYGDGWLASCDDGAALEREQALGMYVGANEEPIVDFDDVSLYDDDDDYDDDNSESSSPAMDVDGVNDDEEDNTENSKERRRLRRLKILAYAYGKRDPHPYRYRGKMQRIIGEDADLDEYLDKLEEEEELDSQCNIEEDSYMTEDEYDWEELQHCVERDMPLAWSRSNEHVNRGRPLRGFWFLDNKPNL